MKLTRLWLAAVCAALAACSSTPEQRPLTLAGALEARDADVGSLVGGRVAEVLVAEGDEVAAGQPLVRLEADLLAPQIDRQRAALAAAEAELGLIEKGPRSEARDRARVQWEAAKTDLGRIENLFHDGVVGRADYDAAQVREAVTRKSWEEADRGSREEEIEAARAAVDRERAQLAFLERQLGELEIVAPAAGRIEAMDLRPGDLVAANQAVARILEPDQLWVRVYVPEPSLARVRVGQRVEVHVDTFPDRTFGGRVVEIRHQAEYLPRNVQTLDQRSDQVFAVRIALDDPGALRPGMAAFATLVEAEGAAG